MALKLLTATNSSQGIRDNDFDWCVEGELVHIGMVCARDRDDPDGGCGCGRSFAGLNSHRATTTAMVRDVPGFTEADYVLAIRSSLEQQGCDPSFAEHEAALLRCLVRDWPVGVIVERRLDEIVVRQVVQP
ncbi:hypothetical protein E1293_27420 [Actinomadura darangshiensis]|uniref:DUF7715 domain-containing protein n=1 Tax=Actinomadura darangshiensis TaxID=705336 RepID=A0A4R5AZL1_9ACTN|nr:hypothetical protein [Actinomadura darangshiensis]TDD76132.1 hypothetical protein E1293_27420 [Actinomadura darangshiensis]